MQYAPNPDHHPSVSLAHNTRVAVSCVMLSGQLSAGEALREHKKLESINVLLVGMMICAGV